MTTFKEMGRVFALVERIPVYRGMMGKMAVIIANSRPSVRGRDVAMQELAPLQTQPAQEEPGVCLVTTRLKKPFSLTLLRGQIWIPGQLYEVLL